MKKHHGFGDTFFVDEVFIRIGGKQHYLWRAVDQDGEVVDVLLQTRRNTAAAMRFSKRILSQLAVLRTRLLPINSEVMMPLREKWEELGNTIHRSIQITAMNNLTGQFEVKSGA